MWIEIYNVWYNLENSYKLSIRDDIITVYFVGDSNPTLIRNVSSKNIKTIKKFLNGRNNKFIFN